MTTGIIVAIFPSRKILLRALDHLTNSESILINRAAIVAKAATGEFVVLDDDMSPSEGSVAGGALGAAMAALGMVQLGALLLPGVGPVIAIGAGALVGGLVGSVTGRFAANLLDFGFKTEQIQALSKRLETGRPALVVELSQPESAIDKLRQALQGYNAEIIEPLHRAITGGDNAEDSGPSTHGGA
ncbi:DUF1269 domain-containing protein [Phototrophicus methaneseepsis]|uniref:DUF1269 domain-containing protein n=1 Tax=Phototrophicus methaneseepsis TaxID=2710758 RepID=A0A7S8IG20_9CHLR|nr:DUF1269 domain-containing protein [Phototrophicus methaneseepsis]QPC84226.1 DUF1269 domain-containing protein [Phototrophicus methaneseepsis]